MSTTEQNSTLAQQKVLQYLNEAHATEHAIARTLQAHIAVTPRGSYRSGLERHLGETKSHAERLERRMNELGISRNIVQMGLGLVESIVGQALAISKTPVDLVRGFSGEEKLLKNAKDQCATEGLEIGTYDAIERLALDVDDGDTAKLAADIRDEEERMLANLRREIPKLVDAVVRSELEGDPSFDPSTIGAVDAARAVQSEVRDTARKATGRAKRTAKQARKVPGVAQAEGEVKGAVADESDLAIANYDSLNASDITSRLNDLSQIDLAKIDAYERKNRGRKSVLDKVNSLRADEPFPGYDELSVDEVRQALAAADDERVEKVREYERRHKDRQGVLEVTDRELAKS